MIVFLDFDGVLHLVRSMDEPVFSKLPLFEELLRRRRWR